MDVVCDRNSLRPSLLSRIKTEKLSNDEACVPSRSHRSLGSMQKVPSISDLSEESSLGKLRVIRFPLVGDCEWVYSRSLCIQFDQVLFFIMIVYYCYLNELHSAL